MLLRFFCEAYRGQEAEELEDIRLKELFDRYWDHKLASVAERMIKGGDERVQEVLQEELGDPHSVYGRIRDAFILLEDVVAQGPRRLEEGQVERHAAEDGVSGERRDRIGITHEIGGGTEIEGGARASGR